jgi:SAM-dependent methyltransferase
MLIKEYLMTAQAEPLTPEMQALKTKLKATWESGDYGVFAKYLEPGALEFFDRLNIAAGTNMLDIACGAGQLTIPAAKRGIRVTGLDLAQNLVDQANARAKEEGLDIQIIQGDAEDLPFEDESFDVALSLIGSMFAPRPERVAAEMLRVVRPGGKIVMGNWTPAGHVGQMFKVIGKHVPPPAIFPSPLLWGDEETVRNRFSVGLSGLEIMPRMYPFKYPFPPADVVEWFFNYYGPTQRALAALDPEGQKDLRKDLVELWTRNNRAGGGATELEGEYLEVVGTKA